jgi:DNA-binding FrmR family transcriptional regulator
VLTDATATPDPPTGGEPNRVELPPETTATVINRLRRAQGQIGGVLRMLEEGRDCRDIVTQMSAVSRAVDRAGFALIAAGLKQCLVDSGGRDTLDTAAMEKLFLSLA